MPNIIVCKFDGKEVKDVTGLSYGVSRTPAPNGTVGSTGHEIGTITITRHKSLQEEGSSATLDNQTLKLAAATQKKAYFKGEITLARPDDATAVVQTIRWDQGHICNMQCSAGESYIQETLTICVTSLKVDDFEFSRTVGKK